MPSPIVTFAETNLNEDSIILQAEKICNADAFKTKKLLCKFLSFIISESLAGREHQLKGYTIAIEVFGREKDFDSDNNALIRIHAGRLRRVLKAYYSDEGQFDEIIIEMPKGGYIPQFTLNTNSKIAEAPKQRIEKDLPTGPSIAILPFENQTGDSSKDYFVRGFSEELSVELTRYEDLVIYDCRETASELFTQYDIHPFITNNDIRFILEGAINFDSTNVKVLVRVTDRHDSKQLWAQSYLRDLSVNNIITIREEIAEHISAIIGGEFGIVLQKVHNEAYGDRDLKIENYHTILKYFHYEQNLTPQAFQDAFIALSQAHEADPNSGIICGLLSSLYMTAYLLDTPITEDDCGLIASLADKAYDLEPNSMIVQTIVAIKHFVFSDRTQFFNMYNRCMNQNPKGIFRLGELAFHASLYGSWEEGKKILDKLMCINVGFPNFFYGITTLYYYRKGEYNKSLIEANKYIYPELFWANLHRIAALGQLNRVTEAVSEIEELLRLKPHFEKQATELISRFIKEEDLVEHVLEGLRKAGMNV